VSGRPTRDTAEGRVYLDLQNLARQAGRPSDELQQLYALEGFLDRLTRSAHADRFVLKGGVLLAAFDTRRPTRDVDLAARDLHNSAEAVRRIVVEIVKIELHDGLALDSQAITAEVIRVGDAYSGVRVSVSGTLASARLLFHVDINVGDPISPAAETVSLPRLLGGELVVTGYPLAEKIVTAVQRGTANTRWRDFTDVARLAAVHRVDGGRLSESLRGRSPNIGRRRSRPSPMCSRAMQAQRRGGGRRGASTDSRKSPLSISRISSHRSSPSPTRF